MRKCVMTFTHNANLSKKLQQCGKNCIDKRSLIHVFFCATAQCGLDKMTHSRSTLYCNAQMRMVVLIKTIQKRLDFRWNGTSLIPPL